MAQLSMHTDAPANHIPVYTCGDGDCFDHFAIMKKILDEKDDKKWDYFVDNLRKNDHKTLKKLLCAQETSSERGMQRH